MDRAMLSVASSMWMWRFPQLTCARAFHIGRSIYRPVRDARAGLSPRIERLTRIWYALDKLKAFPLANLERSKTQNGTSVWKPSVPLVKNFSHH
jgi:hypothetical protein